MTSRPYLSIVIPAYNEAERIVPTLSDVLAWCDSVPFSTEVLVVDDGSHDNTVAVVSEIAKATPRLSVIESRPNRGKGHAVRLGMLTARGELRLFMDADNSVRITEFSKLVHKIDSGAGIAIGSRRAPGALTDTKKAAPLYRRLWSRMTNRIVRAGLIQGIVDTQCGFKLMTRQAAETVFSKVKSRGWGFDLELLARAQRQKYAVSEVAVEWQDDPRSRVRPVRDAIKISIEFFRIRRTLLEEDRQAARSSRPLLHA